MVVITGAAGHPQRRSEIMSHGADRGRSVRNDGDLHPETQHRGPAASGTNRTFYWRPDATLRPRKVGRLWRCGSFPPRYSRLRPWKKQVEMLTRRPLLEKGSQGWDALAIIHFPMLRLSRTLPRTALSRSSAARPPSSMSRSAWNSAPLRRSPLAKGAPRRTTPPPGDPEPGTKAFTHRFRWLGVPVGGIAGLFGSLVGVGGGVIMVPMMTCRPLQLQVCRPEKGARMCSFRHRLF